MKFDVPKYNRRSIRLKGYDYSSPGEYFVTICTHDRECLYGEVINGEMQLNEFGRIARNEWRNTESIRGNVVLDAFVIMPNHMHAILGITTDPHILPGNDIPSVGTYGVGAYRDTPLRDTKLESPTGATNQIDNPKTGKFRSPSKTVGAIVRGYKSAVTKQINQIRNTPGEKVWQRNYYEHIIRNERSLERIRDYIINNPARWEEDRNHPQNF